MNSTDTKPRICQLIYTYNRANIVTKAIESVLSQTYADFELVLINNGSTDHTREVLDQYKDHEKVRVIHLEENRGNFGGLNHALDQIHGEWFGIIGDDDELLPHAFEDAMRIVDEVDPTVNAITGNAISTQTGNFAGLGLHENQYLTVGTIIQKTGGDFFGLAKAELVGDLRLNEKLYTDSNTLWYQIDAKANRYYLHKALMVYNDRAGETETSRNRVIDPEVRKQRYRELLKEPVYWELIKKYDLNRFQKGALRGYCFMKIDRDKKRAKQYLNMLNSTSKSLKVRGMQMALQFLPAPVLAYIFNMAGSNRSLSQLIQVLFRKRALN